MKDASEEEVKDIVALAAAMETWRGSLLWLGLSAKSEVGVVGGCLEFWILGESGFKRPHLRLQRLWKHHRIRHFHSHFFAAVSRTQ